MYWTKPKTEPPGGTFRLELLHGFTLASDQEIDAVIRSVSEEFQGTSYNLLTNNCNHFTSHLVKKLTGTPGPGWLNRAAAIGVAFPCIVPRDWVDPPDRYSYETDEAGADTDIYSYDESARMLRPSDETPRLVGGPERSVGGMEFEQGSDSDDHGPTRDSEGRQLPVSERAPRQH